MDQQCKSRQRLRRTGNYTDRTTKSEKATQEERKEWGQAITGGNQQPLDGGVAELHPERGQGLEGEERTAKEERSTTAAIIIIIIVRNKPVSNDSTDGEQKHAKLQSKAQSKSNGSLPNPTQKQQPVRENVWPRQQQSRSRCRHSKPT